MEFVKIRAPFDDHREFRVGVDEDRYYHPCDAPDVGGPFASLTEAAAAIYRRLLCGDASSAANPAPLPEDAGRAALRCDKDANAMSTEALTEPEVLPLESPQHTPLKESSTGSSSSSESVSSDIFPPSKLCLKSSPGSTSMIWERIPKGRGLFLIRMDRYGSYHTYPALGGPFQSLHEADDAINNHVNAKQHATVQDPEACNAQPGESYMDWLIRTNMYGPNGRQKKSSKSERIQNEYKQRLQFIQAMLEKYNEDQNLFGDLAYEVKDVVHSQLIIEGLAWYKHFNFTAKTKGANDSNCCMPNLFFAEAMSLQGEDDWVISCCCMIKPDDIGVCYGCKNDGNVDMKHPCDAVAYIGGHWDVCMPFECWDSSDSDEEEDEETEVERLRNLFAGLDDPKEMASLFD